MNRQVAVFINDMRNAGDLVQLQRTSHEDCLSSVKGSIDKLVEGNMAPRSATVEMPSVRAAWDFVRKQDAGLSNQELLALLAEETKARPITAPFYSFVVRCWLMSPPESVVESMASTAQNVFGTHRQLQHTNAALELQIRWNGPSVFSADAVLEACLTQFKGRRFTRVKDIGPQVESIVTQRLMKKCRRHSVFK